MGFGDWFRGLFSGSKDSKVGGSLLAGLFPSGVPPKRGTRELLQAYTKSPWLRSIVHRISNDVAAVPLQVLAPASGRKKSIAAISRTVRQARGRQRRDMVNSYAASGDLVPLDDHPLLSLFDTMNPSLRRIGSFFVAQAFQEVKGEGFFIKERALDGTVLELWPIPPLWCQSTPSASSPVFSFRAGSFARDVPEDDVIWLRSPQLENPYSRGAGIAEALGDELDIDEFAAQHVKSWFFNRAMPDVFVSMEGIESKEEAELFEQKLRAKHQGSGKAFRVHVGNGKMNVQQVGQTFREQQIGELRRQERDTFLQVWNVPPEVVGLIENSNRSTIDAAYYLYALGVLCPRLDFLADGLQQLAEERGEPLIVDYVSPVPEDREFQKSIVVAMPENFTRNEVRALAGMAPREGWDDELAEKPASSFPPLPPGGGEKPAEPMDDAPDMPEPEDDPEPEDETKAARRRSLRAVP